MEFETILTEERDGVFIITFNRLEARNAINNLMTKELSGALDYWDKNDELRACVLTNNGHVFCAGSDLKELAEDAWEMPEGREKWGFAACTKRYFDKPLIAAVRGKTSGSIEIVAACDLAVASDESIFGLPEPRVGLTAAGGGTLLRLAQQIPMKFAMELLLVAEPISAQKANEWGLVNYVVPDDQVVDKAVELWQRRSRSVLLFPSNTAKRPSSSPSDRTSSTHLPVGKCSKNTRRSRARAKTPTKARSHSPKSASLSGRVANRRTAVDVSRTKRATYPFE